MRPVVTGPPNPKAVSVVVPRWVDFWTTIGNPASPLYADTCVFTHVDRSPAPLARAAAGIETARDEFIGALGPVALDVRGVVSCANHLVIEAMAHDPATRWTWPVCDWLRLDENHLVVDEQVFADPSWLRGDPRPPARIEDPPCPSRAAPWYAELADRLYDYWANDPKRMVEEIYAADATLDDIGRNVVVRGTDQFWNLERGIQERLPYRKTYPGLVIGTGNRVCIMQLAETKRRPDGPARWTPLSIILTLTPDGQAISDHTYMPRSWPPEVVSESE